MVSPSASSTFPCPVQCVSLIPMMSMPLLVISLDTMAMFPLRYSVLMFQFPIFMVSFGCNSRIGPEASSRLWPLGVMLSLLGLAAASRRLGGFALLVVSKIEGFSSLHYFSKLGYWPRVQPPVRGRIRALKSQQPPARGIASQGYTVRSTVRSSF